MLRINSQTQLLSGWPHSDGYEIDACDAGISRQGGVFFGNVGGINGDLRVLNIHEASLQSGPLSNKGLVVIARL